MRYILLTILGLLLVVGVLATTKFAQFSMLIGAGKAMQAAGPPPETVSSVIVERQSWDSTFDAVATVVASKGVVLSNDAAGLVARIHFESGALVRQGQPLVELDSSVERAQLASLRARKQLAELSLGRTQALVSSGSIAQAQYDADRAALESLVADEKALLAQIERKVVKAPFSGKLGLRNVNLGQYLAPGTPVAALESTKSVYLDFTLPQSRLPMLKLDAPVRAYVDGATEPLATGSISAIEPKVDTSTRSVKVRANVANEDDKLRPGMFLRVSVVQSERREVTSIPATAVVHASYGDSVYCVESKPSTDAQGKSRKIARQQFVKLGEPRGDYLAILDGLQPGQEIVSAGAFKLRNGVPVAINNEIRVEPQLLPNPVNR
jgi:membrane fusion protein, multidrug efflux system